jgi:DNA-binding NtrC family response regulator
VNELTTAGSGSEFIGAHPAVERLRDDIQLAARSEAKVLITGESGVGKEIAARLIHTLSARSRRPLVTLNCAGVPDTLLESELFGHVRGSFTGAYRDKPGVFAQANQGTVFLDEVGEMSLRMQGVLLRFLETGELQRVGSDRVEGRVNVRIVAATNRNLLEGVEGKTFREDLYYRLNVLHLNVPTLRERSGDVPLLMAHFLATFSRQYGIREPQVSEEAMSALTQYSWPGNVRELRNIAERIVVRSRSSIVSMEELPKEIARTSTTAAAPGAGARTAPARPADTGVVEPDQLPVPMQTTGLMSPLPDRRHQVADTLYDALVKDGASFWEHVHPIFLSRDITRHDLRELVRRGLRESGGRYKTMVALFGMPSRDYRRFMNFLTAHDCSVEFREFRAAASSANTSSGQAPARSLRRSSPARSLWQKQPEIQDEPEIQDQEASELAAV